MKKQIIALGDGGFSSDNNPVLDLYILAQTNKKDPKVCFIPTASCDNGGLIERFYDVFDKYYCIPSHLSLFNFECDNLQEFILSQDVIYVGGGHSKNMMGIWKEWGLDRLLKDAYNQGTILSGTSAGSVCWFEQCITDSYGKELKPMNCLGMLKGSNCPHYNNDGRRAAYHTNLKDNRISAGYAADNQAGLHFIDGEFVRAISSVKGAYGYKVEYVGLVNDGNVLETKLDTIRLNPKKNFMKYIGDTKTFREVCA